MGLTGLHDSYVSWAFVYLPFTFRSLDLFCRFTLVYEVQGARLLKLSKQILVFFLEYAYLEKFLFVLHCLIELVFLELDVFKVAEDSFEYFSRLRV